MCIYSINNNTGVVTKLQFNFNPIPVMPEETTFFTTYRMKDAWPKNVSNKRPVREIEGNPKIVSPSFYNNIKLEQECHGACEK